MSGELCPDFCPLKNRLCSRACGRVWSGGMWRMWGEGGRTVKTVHAAEKLDRLSAECAAGLWRLALLWESRMEECASRAQGVETRFPVCISCVFNVELRARACFLCVMGARPETPTQRQHKGPPMSVAGQAAGIHIRLLRLLYTDSDLQSLRSVSLWRQSSLFSFCLPVFIINSDRQRPQDLCPEGSIQRGVPLDMNTVMELEVWRKKLKDSCFSFSTNTIKTNNEPVLLLILSDFLFVTLSTRTGLKKKKKKFWFGGHVKAATVQETLIFCWFWRFAVDKSWTVSKDKTTKYNVKNKMTSRKISFCFF